MKKNVIRTHKNVASVASRTMRNSKSSALRRVAASALSNRRRGAR